jgi:hypothetical protein
MFASSSRRRRDTISQVSVSAVTPAPAPAPILAPVLAPTQTPAPIPTISAPCNYHLVLSSRDNVGFPDYTHHPRFHWGRGVPETSDYILSTL